MNRAVVVTHSGRFHLDEVMATAILSSIFGLKEVIRTRDIEKIGSMLGQAYIIDVGQAYNPEKLLFDHHQETFNDTYSDKFTIPLSSCGLIYRHYGNLLWNVMIGKDVDQQLVDRFYKEFVLPIDAGDNGVAITNGKMRYYPVDLGGLVSRLNGEDVNDHEKQMTRFMEAVDVCRLNLKVYMEAAARNYALYTIDMNRFKAELGNQTGEILVLNEPIKFNRYLKEFDPGHTIKFIVHPRSDQWQVSTVCIEQFKHLASIIGADKAKKMFGNKLVFVHKARFIGVMRTKEAAIELAQASLREYYSLYNYCKCCLAWVRGIDWSRLGYITTGIAIASIAFWLRDINVLPFSL